MKTTTGKVVYEVVNKAGDVVKHGAKGACLKWLLAQGFQPSLTSLMKVNDRWWVSATGEKLALIRA